MKIIETQRLVIRKAKVNKKDIELYFRLWNQPEVMKNVGFPKGLQITEAEIEQRLANQTDSILNSLLIVELKETGELIGEAKLGKPNEQKIAHTDIKLLPEFWGKNYGIEIKKALVSYLFDKTNSVAIEAGPNVKNIASIKMQEAAGYKRIRKGVHQFPDSMRDKTESVEYFVYRLDKKDWKK